MSWSRRDREGFLEMAQLQLMARLEHETGKTGSELLDVILAWKDSHERVTTLEAKNLAAGELEQPLAKARQEHKLTSAEELTLRKQVARGELTMKGVAAWLAAKSPNRILHNGKTWAQMSGRELEALLKDNPKLYAQMRDEFMENL